MIFWENNDDVRFLDISWLILSLFLPHRARIFLLNRLGLFLHQSECQKAGFGAQIGINMKFFWDKYQDVVTFLGICWLIFFITSPTLDKDLSLKSFGTFCTSFRMPKSWVWITIWHENQDLLRQIWQPSHFLCFLCQKSP